MLIKYLYTTLLFVAFAFPLSLTSQVIDLGPVKSHCASSEEMKLYDLITEYRRINKLPAIPFSRSLSYVARTHAMDLQFNRPDFGGCIPHSWSDKGKWKPCCYAHDKNRQLCMNDKPKEITGYKFKGWEMVYSGGEEAKAGDAFDLWKDLGLTNDYLLNTGKWLKSWKAIGIGFYGDYATVWFGEGVDPEKGFGPCVSDTSIVQSDTTVSKEMVTGEIPVIGVPQTGPKYYIITGSLNTLEKANHEVARLRGLGYKNARLIPKGSNFRISVAEFSGEVEAQAALPALQQTFDGAWVLKPGQ